MNANDCNANAGCVNTDSTSIAFVDKDLLEMVMVTMDAYLLRPNLNK